MDIKCPHCGTEYEVEKKDMYHYVKCSVCSQGFVAGALAGGGGGSNKSKSDNAPVVSCGNTELKYFGIFLLYVIGSPVVSSILGAIVGLVVGFFMGAYRSSMESIVDICGSLGVVIGFAISAISFRDIVLRFLDKEHRNQHWVMPWLSLVVLSAVVGFLFKIVASVNTVALFREIGVEGVVVDICSWLLFVSIEYLVFRFVLAARRVWMNYLSRFEA